MLGLGLGLNKSNRSSGGFNPSSFTLHFWDSKNLTDIGSTITVPDTGTIGGLDMTNPDASSKPTVVSDYLQFVTDDVIRALTANFRGSDSSGEFISHVRLDSGIAIFDLATWDSSSITGYINQSSISSNTYRSIHNVTAVRSQRGSTNISSGWFTVTSGCTGSAYYIIISGNNETLTALNGANDGNQWLNDQTTNDSIAIGGRLSSSPAYANISWKCGGYAAFSSLAESIELNQQIHNYYT